MACQNHLTYSHTVMTLCCPLYNLQFISKKMSSRFLFFHFSKRNNLTSFEVEVKWKVNFFSSQRSLKGLELSPTFDEWELFPFGCIISHLQRATFVHQWNFVGYTGKSSLHIGQENDFTFKKDRPPRIGGMARSAQTAVFLNLPFPRTYPAIRLGCYT